MLEVRAARILVTGGTGFLGRHVVEELRAAGAEVVALGRADGDLGARAVVDELLDRHRPDAVVHLAAVVGGIGANRAEPGRFLYENARMGLEVLDGCRVAGVRKVVVAGTVCAYPEHTPVPFSEDALWLGYPEPTNAPYGIAKRMLIVMAQALPPAVRHQHRHAAPGEPLRPRRPLRPGLGARDPRADPAVRRGARAG